VHRRPWTNDLDYDAARLRRGGLLAAQPAAQGNGELRL
ncbi:MAG: hypothetical protein AVDCRST_MAG39-2655, partial [uncultured Sphingomonadaceae bacterium]